MEVPHEVPPDAVVGVELESVYQLRHWRFCPPGPTRMSALERSPELHVAGNVLWSTSHAPDELTYAREVQSSVDEAVVIDYNSIPNFCMKQRTASARTPVLQRSACSVSLQN